MDEARATELLTAERARIERELRELAAPEDSELADVDQHLADYGSELYDREADEGRLEDLRAVERAEARLAAGTYGLSVESGKPIPDERLQAHPTAERTVEEEAALE